MVTIIQRVMTILDSPSGILAAAELQGDLHVVGVDVVEVLHPPVQRVPVRTIGDAVIEEPPD